MYMYTAAHIQISSIIDDKIMLTSVIIFHVSLSIISALDGINYTRAQKRSRLMQNVIDV